MPLHSHTQRQFVIGLNCHTTGLTMAASVGLSILVPFFGGDDDIAALLLAMAIVDRNTTAKLVILSFLEPEKQVAVGNSNSGSVISGPEAAGGPREVG